MLALSHQWLEPGRQFRLVLADERPAHRRQMLHGMGEVQPLARLRPAVVGQPPQPHRPVPKDQRPGRLAQPAPQRLGTLALALGFTVEGGARQAEARQVLQHGAGLQPEGGVGGGTPLLAALAVAPGALDGDEPEAALEGAGVTGGQTPEGLAAHRTGRRGGVGIGLRTPCDRLPEQFSDVVGGLQLPDGPGFGRWLGPTVAWNAPTRTPPARPAPPAVRTGREGTPNWKQTQGSLFSCRKLTPLCKKLRCAPSRGQLWRG